MDLLIWLQNWYQSECDGDWEHLYGVKIDTLDNPGWMVSIDLKETELENKPFCEVRTDNGESDWIICSVKNAIFEGIGDAGKLTEIIRIFKEWAESYKI
ncbi:MAG: immunity 53 family protein [Oscillospiraceae bacterium]|nr:immunity 53 family protein [Oscillospiraceae bacterium]